MCHALCVRDYCTPKAGLFSILRPWCKTCNPLVLNTPMPPYRGSTSRDGGVPRWLLRWSETGSTTVKTLTTTRKAPPGSPGLGTVTIQLWTGSQLSTHYCLVASFDFSSIFFEAPTALPVSGYGDKGWPNPPGGEIQVSTSLHLRRRAWCVTQALTTHTVECVAEEQG